MSRLRWHLKTIATHSMKDLWQHVKPYGQFVLFGEHSIAYCPPPKSRGRSTPDLLVDYQGNPLAVRPDERAELRILAPFVRQPIAIWPNWALFAVYCVAHQLAAYPLPARPTTQAIGDCEGMWTRDGKEWSVVGETKRHKTTIYSHDGAATVAPDTTTISPVLDVDSLIPVLWSMLLNHQPIVDGLELPDRRLPEHVIEAYYETHPYKKRSQTAATD